MANTIKAKTTAIQDLEAARALLISALWKCHENNGAKIEHALRVVDEVLGAI